VQKTIAALFDAVAWIRTNRSETSKMIAEKFKITPAEANGTYDTLLSMFNRDGRLPPKSCARLSRTFCARNARFPPISMRRSSSIFHVARSEIETQT
jgi:hypothetical protein